MASLASVLLSDDVLPVLYTMSLSVDLTNFKVSGEQAVEIVLAKDTQRLVLHGVDLEIDPATVSWTDKSGVSTSLVGGVIVDESTETVVFDFGSPLAKGTGVLKVKWKTTLGDNLKGFYRSKYTSVDGQERYMAVTQFEATDARRCFPCFDEPAKKARFLVTLEVPSTESAISNMPIKKSTHLGQGMVRHEFDETPIMSTYLLAFIVGQFDFVSLLSSNAVRTTVYTPRGKSDLGRHALHVASEALPFFEKQFGIKYPLPKSDLLAIPDFDSGAMENWGAVTYRETRLCIDAELSTITSVQACTRTVCHELAHMWFGNYVTMKWWTHLWLNEGFARFMEFKAVDHVFPEWKIWIKFVLSVQGAAFDLDSLSTSHPVQVPVVHPSEIFEIFDLISYAKGASIIRMLSDYLGDDTFMKGIKNYLQKHAYGNAKTEDLWAAIAEASQQPVAEIMNHWVTKVGFPVVSIVEIKSKSASVRTFELEQSRFGEDLEEKDTIWQIPIRISTQQGVEQVFLLTAKSATVDVQCTKGDYVRFNSGQAGFFRCCYVPDSEVFKDLSKAIEKVQMTAADRLGVQSDVFACAKVGLTPLSQALDLAQKYANEPETAVIQELRANLVDILGLYADDEVIAPGLKKLLITLFKPILAKVGWNKAEGEPATRSLCRATAVSALMQAEDTDTMIVLSDMFKNRNTTSIDADIRPFAYRAAVAIQGVSAYEELLDICNTAPLAAERLRAMTALSSASDPVLQKRTLEWVLASGQVRNQDLTKPISAVANSKNGNRVVWEWFKNDACMRLKQLLANHEQQLARVIEVCIDALVTFEDAQDVVNFFEEHHVDEATRRINQSVESIRHKAARKERELPELRKYFA